MQNVITALTSDRMIAPSYWVDPKSGNDYLLTVQYPESTIKDFTDVMAIPLRGQGHLSEAYAPLALAIIGGLLTSVVLTVFIVPAAYLLIYRKRELQPSKAETSPA